MADKSLNKYLKQLKKSSGATLVEYALLIVLISILVTAALTAMGRATSEVFSNTSSTLAAGI